MTGSIPCPVAANAFRRPRSIAILTDNGAISATELHALVRDFEFQLAEGGVGSGDIVAVVGEASPAYVALLVAGLRSGVTIAPMSTRLPEALLDAQVRKIGAVMTVRPDDLRSQMQSADPPVNGDFRWALDAHATVVFTSGSTGEPRAAVHCVGNHVVSAEGSRTNIAVGEGDGWLLSLPLYHVGGLAIVFRCLLSGCMIVMSERDAGEAVLSHGATHVSFVPTQLQRTLDALRGASLKAVLLGGSVLPEPLIEATLEARLPVHTSYGLTEMASQVTTTRPGARIGELLTAGFVLPGREVRIAADGRILVRGATRFLGYLENGRLEKPFDSDGWYRSGDVGRFDEHDRLVVLGRGDQVFISGGENIHPEQIERALLRIDGIREAVVVPVDDPEFGQRPVAFINPGATLDLPALRARLSEALPRFMLPIALLELPPMEGLKHDRSRLAQIARRDRHVAR